MPTLLFYTAEDRLGDALIKLPAILALKKARPEVFLVWVAGERRSAYTQLLKPLVGGVFDELHEAIGLGARWLQTMIPFWPRSFDAIIASDAHLRNTLALRRIPHQRFISPYANYLLSDRKPRAACSDHAIFRQTLQLLNLALDVDLCPAQQLEIPAEYTACAAHLLPDGVRYVGFIPGAGGKDKCWPLARYLEVANMQAAYARQAVFFLGPEELEWRTTVERAVPGVLIPEWDEEARVLRGPTLTIALARRLRAAVANDSGGGHLAAAGGRPVITLIGRTNEHKFESPYAARQVLRARDYGGENVELIPIHAVTDLLDKLCVDA